MSLHLSSISTPTLLLDPARATANIEKMARKAAQNGLRFRPHFKTHQSAAIGSWFRAVGVTSITVSSVAMARYFADHGWTDITIAFPVNLRQIEAIDELAARVDLHLLADAPGAVDLLSVRLTNPVNLWVEIDTGYQRSGVRWDDEGALTALAASLTRAAGITVRGVLAHAGHTYGARTSEKVAAIYAREVECMVAARDRLAAGTGIDNLAISVGDTPACSMVNDLRGVDEMRPGNFVFYDLTQERIGACTEDEIAVAVACPVVGIYPARRELVLYGGAIHLSKEALKRADGAADFGHVALLDAEGWGATLPGVHLRSVSQEHGVVAVTPEAWPTVAQSVALGGLVAVLPVHSCLTADLLKRYLTLDNRTIEMAPIP